MNEEVVNEEVINEELSNENVSYEEQDVSMLQDFGEDVEAATLEEECDISMKSISSDEVDLTEVSMNETTASDDDDGAEENKEKVKKLKNIANELLYSDDESEQLNLAEEMKSMIVTVQQIKTSGAGLF